MQEMGRLVNNSFVPVIIVIEFKSALPQDCFYSYRGPLTVWNFYFWSKQIESEVKETLISSREFAKEKMDLLAEAKSDKFSAIKSYPSDGTFYNFIFLDSK